MPLGITGLSVVKHLKRLPLDLQVKVIDTRATPPGQESLPEDVELHTDPTSDRRRYSCCW